jgi:DNA-binding Xre family transcriptional regulator
MIRLKVKEVAESRNINRSKLSRMSDVDIKTIRRIFNHPTEPVTTTILDRIATALEVDVTELIESVLDE